MGAPFQPSPGGEGANTGPSAAMARVAVWFPAVQGPCVRAEERSARDGWGCRRTPPTSTSDLPQLFERSAQREVSSAARPARCAPRHGHKGFGQPESQTSTRAIAALGPWMGKPVNLFASGFVRVPSEAMARLAVRLSNPLWMRLRRGVCGVRRGTHFAAAQLRSDNRGESVNEA